MGAMDVTPQELRGSEIKESWRGYDRDAVDDLLERAAVTIEGLTQRVQEAASRPMAAARPAAEVPLPSSREDAEMLQRTLLLAQRAADEAVNEAQARARQILDESEAKAQSLVSDAEATARRIAEGERRRLEAEIQDLSSRRELLRADADALDAYAAGYRDRLRAVLEADLARLGGDVDPPSPRPELHEVEVPIAAAPEDELVLSAAEPAAADPVVPDNGFDDGPSGWDAGPETRPVSAVGVNDPDTGPGSGGGSSFASQGEPGAVAAATRTAPEWPPPAPAAEATSAGSPDASWLTESDEWAAPEATWEAPPPWERGEPAEQPTAAAVFASEVPMDAHPVDTDSLDDDAFFASLREAVRDDAPLGPSEDEQNTFFEGEMEQDRRRFRRRR
jgi:cell division septum initiation protein DivIVA